MKFLITHPINIESNFAHLFKPEKTDNLIGPVSENFETEEFTAFYEQLFSYIRNCLNSEIVEYINNCKSIKEDSINMLSNNVIGDYEVSIQNIRCKNIKDIITVMPLIDFIVPKISIFKREQTRRNKIFENLHAFCIQLAFINKVPITKELKRPIELEKSYTIVYPMIIDERWKFPNDYAEFEKIFNALKLIAI